MKPFGMAGDIQCEIWSIGFTVHGQVIQRAFERSAGIHGAGDAFYGAEVGVFEIVFRIDRKGAGVFGLPGAEETLRVNFAPGNRVCKDGVKISWTVKTEIVDFQMVNLKIFRLFSWLSAENHQKSVAGMNIVNDYRIFLR